MEIRISQEQLDKAINENVEKAISNALSGYSVQAAIADKITNEVATGVIGDSLNRAISEMDTDKLTRAISEQIQKAMISTVNHILTEGLISTILELRKIPSYDDKKREQAAAEIRVMLKGK